MIIDADTHLAPHDWIASISDKNYVTHCLDNNRPVDKQQIWQDFYHKIQDPSWPPCGHYSDFKKLPLHIRSEIALSHQDIIISVSQNLDHVTISSLEDDAPLLDDFAAALQNIIKADRALINPQAASMRMQYGLPPELAVEIMQGWNRKILDICNHHSQFDANAWLALQDLDASLDELQWIFQHDFFGIYLSDRVPWGFMPRFWPMFASCEAKGLPIYLHFSVFEELPLHWSWDRSDLFYDTLKTHWPRWYDSWMIGIASMIAGGLCDRYPNLKIVVAERGVHWMIELRNFMLSQSWVDPLPYFQRNFWCTFESEEPFQHIADLVGWDRLLFASDYPHNDRGGKNRFHDVSVLQDCLESSQLDKDQFDLLTHKNYAAVKSRT